MNVAEILSQREDQHLEFKSANVLDQNLDSVARAVVGMLNADGGEIWIGVEDSADVATAIQPVSGPEQARTRLWDHLVETIVPLPLQREVTIEISPADRDPALLVVRVQPPPDATGRRPFAHRQRGGWHFVRRIDARNHAMSHEEVFLRAVTRSESREADEAIRKLEVARRDSRDSGRDGLWMGFETVRRIQLDLQATSDEATADSPMNEPTLLEIASDPSVTGNRRVGAHFAMANQPPRPVDGGFEWGWWSRVSSSAVSSVVARQDGALRFWAALTLLQAPQAFFAAMKGGEGREIDAQALYEFPISAFRIAGQIYRQELAPDDLIATDLALFGVGGWTLRREAPGAASFGAGKTLERLEQADLIWEPLLFRFGDIKESPDRCGFRLVRRVYQAFGIAEGEMPDLYDRESGRLVLPE